MLICSILINISYGQENKNAEELFENTFPLGISVGIQTTSYNKSGDSGPFEHDLSNLWMPEIGLKYNILQKNNFSFNAGIYMRFIKYNSFIYSYKDEEDIFNPVKSPLNDITYHIPLTAEYIFHSSESISFAGHIGYELQYYRYPHLWAHEQTVKDPYSTGTVSIYGNSLSKEFSHGINLGAGLYKKLGKQLLKFELNYQFHFEKIMENKLTATNFPNQPDVNHSVNWNGNHLSAKVTYYPFRKSNQ